MAEVGESAGVPVVDLYGRMRDPAVYTDAGHVNARGMVQKAQIVYDAISARVAGMVERLGETGG